jgi:hypothetical protein
LPLSAAAFATASAETMSIRCTHPCCLLAIDFDKRVAEEGVPPGPLWPAGQTATDGWMARSRSTGPCRRRLAAVPTEGHCPPARRLRQPQAVHRPSPIAHRPSPIAHRPSSMAHRPWPIVHGPSPVPFIASAVHRQCRSSPVPFIASAVHPPPRWGNQCTG